MPTEEEKKDQGAESPMALKFQREMPNHVFAVAAQNAKSHFFIPSNWTILLAFPTTIS